MYFTLDMALAWKVLVIKIFYSMTLNSSLKNAEIN